MVSLVLLERRLLTGITLTAPIILASVFLAGIGCFHTVRITEVASSTYSGLIIFVVTCFLAIGFAAYCAWIYERLHYRFLITLVVVLAAGLGFLSLTAFNMNDTVFAYVESVWDQIDSDDTDALEKQFSCNGFDADPPDQSVFNVTANCAVVLRSYIGGKATAIAVTLLVFFIIYTLLGSFWAYLACRKSGVVFEIEPGKEMPDLGQGLMASGDGNGEEMLF
jgi:hypothetical protein